VTSNAKREARWFLSQLRPLLRAHLISITLVVLGSSMFLLDPLLLKWLIDKVLPKKDLGLLLIAAAGFLGIYVCRLGMSAGARLLSFRTVQTLVLRLRLNVLQQLNRLSAQYHESSPLGDTLYRIEQDVDQVAEIGSGLVPSVLQAIVNAVFVITTICILNWRLTLVLVPLLPLFFVFRTHFGSRLRFASDSNQQAASDENEFLQEHLSSVIQIQLLRQERAQAENFLRRATAKREAANYQTLTEVLFATCYMGLIALGTVGILSYGGYQVVVGTLTVGGLVAFYSYLGRLFDPLNVAVDIYSRLNRLRSSIRRLLDIIEQIPGVENQPNCIRLSSLTKGSINISDVSFSYRVGGSRVLERLNLQIKPGEKVALVGASGSGKSTITKLIARLYDVRHGKICIDELDVRAIDLNSLRTAICYVMQETMLFDRSLKENLMLGNPQATEEELICAIEMADLGPLLQHLPDGWNTPLGPRGNTLSGGERQRLALARAVLLSPSLLILDESTSALDAPTEQRIFANLRRHFSHQTMILISHRVPALSWVDRIIVLDQGRIAEEGTHEYLCERGGIYRNLYNSQPTGDSMSASKPAEPPEFLSYKPVIAGD
jgi:ABC-type bacteriocin/lantibiotic exporter with double-glycine peptidase domain